MPRGPGKYDEVCTAARLATLADAVVLIVIDGDKGSGFSVQSVTTRSVAITARLPALLRSVADKIEASED